MQEIIAATRAPEIDIIVAIAHPPHSYEEEFISSFL